MPPKRPELPPEKDNVMSAKQVTQSRAFRHNVRVLRFRHVVTALTGLGVFAAGIASAIISMAHM